MNFLSYSFKLRRQLSYIFPLPVPCEEQKKVNCDKFPNSALRTGMMLDQGGELTGLEQRLIIIIMKVQYYSGATIRICADKSKDIVSMVRSIVKEKAGLSTFLVDEF